MAGADPLRSVAAAYQGLERPESFTDSAARDRYRAELLQRSADQVAFLRARLPARCAVVEAACGNGRLLVGLALAGGLEAAFGFDIAGSRIDFATQWADDLGLGQRLRLEVADALTVPLSPQAFDGAVLITGALGYFGPADPDLPAVLLSRLRAALRPEGLLVLELYPHVRERRLLEAADGDLRLWRELPDDDPWRFYLSHLRLEGDVLVHDKTFVHRTTGLVDEGRREHLTLYSPDQVRALLASTGFIEVELYDGWSDRPYAGGETLVVTARAVGDRPV